MDLPPPPTLSTLPTELLHRIAVELEPRELVRLSLTCGALEPLVDESYVWHRLAVLRFGKQRAEGYKTEYYPDEDEPGDGAEEGEEGEEEQGPVWKRVYRDLSDPFFSAENMDIAHMNGHYWRMVEAEDSRSDRVAYLNAVCWFDVGATVPSIPTNREYSVTWRIALGFNAPSGALDGLRFTARAVDPSEPRDELPGAATEQEISVVLDPPTISRLKAPAPRSRLYGMRMEPGGPVWRALHVGTLRVPSNSEAWEGSRRYAGIEVRAWSHTGHWKSHVWIDGVQIVPVGREDEDPGSAGSGSSVGTSSSSGSSYGRPEEGGSGLGGWVAAGRQFLTRFFPG